MFSHLRFQVNKSVQGWLPNQHSSPLESVFAQHTSPGRRSGVEVPFRRPEHKCAETESNRQWTYSDAWFTARGACQCPTDASARRGTRTRKLGLHGFTAHVPTGISRPSRPAQPACKQRPGSRFLLTQHTQELRPAKYLPSLFLHHQRPLRLVSRLHLQSLPYPLRVGVCLSHCVFSYK